MSYSIAPLRTETELQRCAELLKLAFNQTHGDAWTDQTALRKLDIFYRTPHFRGWVVREDGDIVAGCVGNLEAYFTGDYLYLKEMFTHPDHQKRGIGDALMQRIKTDLAAENIGMIILFTPTSGHQYPFYQKRDFQEMDDMRMFIYAPESEAAV